MTNQVRVDMTKPTCCLPDCDKPVYQTRPMCGSHYMKNWRYGDPYYKAPRRISDMAGRTFGLLTVMHFVPDQGWFCMCACGANRVVSAGELNAGRATSCGNTRLHWRHDHVGYAGMHSRVKVERGLAHQYQCIDCGHQAQQWSYDHADPDEQIEAGMGYSLDPAHYDPRCVPCHKRFDLQYLEAQGWVHPNRGVLRGPLPYLRPSHVRRSRAVERRLREQCKDQG